LSLLFTCEALVALELALIKRASRTEVVGSLI